MNESRDPPEFSPGGGIQPLIGIGGIIGYKSGTNDELFEGLSTNIRMYKIIIILILLVILFLMVRKALRDWGQSKEIAAPGKDVMIQDPVCKVYVAAGTAIVQEVGGQQYYFCSQDCARHFKRGDRQ